MLVGVIDPSHKARALERKGKLPPWISLEELAVKSQEGSSKWSPWPYELVQAALGEHQERGDAISTTALTASCPRGLVLERKVDYVASLDSMYPALRGTLLHKILEGYAREGSIAEARFFTEVDGVELSCSPDLLTQETVYDYKMTENPPTFGYPYRHHTEQLMYNAFIVRHAHDWETADGAPLPFDPREYPVTNAVVVYMGPKGPKPILVEHKETFVTPKGVHKEGNRPFIWSDREVLEAPPSRPNEPGLRARLHALVKALESFPVFLPELVEVWGGKADWSCPGPPLCHLPNCLAKRDPSMYVWENPR